MDNELVRKLQVLLGHIDYALRANSRTRFFNIAPMGVAYLLDNDKFLCDLFGLDPIMPQIMDAALVKSEGDSWVYVGERRKMAVEEFRKIVVARLLTEEFQTWES